MNADQAKKLRAPFPPEQIGKLPKAGIMLDYVGHAATTDRLLQVDPAWTWEPMAVDATGAPVVVQGGIWIKLTVCGVTRPGFGDGKTPKEMIGDAIRNAAMRFGVALDLWAKEDLSGSDEAASTPVTKKKPGTASSPGAPSREPVSSNTSEGEPKADASVSQAAESEPASPSDEPPVMISFDQRGKITQLIVEAAAANNSTVDHLTKTLVGQYGPFDKLTAFKADELIGKLARWAANAEKAEAAA